MRRAFAVLVALLLVVTLLPAPAGAVHDTGQQFRVFLEPDGDARVALSTTYDLSNESERERFAALSENATAREERRVEYRQRLDLGQAIAESRTGREMAVSAVRLNATRDGETGVVRLSAPWSNLAAVDGAAGTLAVTAPFGHERFPVNRTLVLVGPDGFTRAAAEPLPDRALKNRAYWGRETNLTGFRATFSGPVVTPASQAPTDSPTATAAPVTGAGLSALFGAAVLAAIPAVAVALAVTRRGGRE